MIFLLHRRCRTSARRRNRTLQTSERDSYRRRNMVRRSQSTRRNGGAPPMSQRELPRKNASQPSRRSLNPPRKDNPLPRKLEVDRCPIYMINTHHLGCKKRLQRLREGPLRRLETPILVSRWEPNRWLHIMSRNSVVCPALKRPLPNTQYHNHLIIPGGIRTPRGFPRLQTCLPLPLHRNRSTEMSLSPSMAMLSRHSK